MQPVKYKRIAVALAGGIGALALILVVRTVEKSKNSIPSDFQQTRFPEGRQVMLGLKTISVLEEVRLHLLDGEFEIVKRMDEIPTSCVSVFKSSFVTTSGGRVDPGEIALANPGERFQASDNIVPGFPFRRLEFAGLGTTKCFIHYQNGGKPSSFCLAVIDYPSRKTVWVGESERAATNLADLRQMISHDGFRHVAWLPVC